MESDRPLLNIKCIIKGAAAGGLLAGAFIIPTAIIVKFIFFIAGFLVIVDDVMPSENQFDYPLLSLVGFGLGFLVAVGFSLAKFDFYAVLLLFVTVLVYLVKLAKRMGIITE